MTNFIVNIAVGAEKDIVHAAKTMITYVDGVVVKDIDPALSNLINTVIPDAITAIKPYAETALAELITDIPAFLAGGLPAVAAVLGPLLTGTGAKALAAGISVVESDALAAIHAVLADLFAANAAPTPAPTPAA